MKRLAAAALLALTGLAPVSYTHLDVYKRQGLVLASDTRTNAGVDQVAISPKMHVFELKNCLLYTSRCV